MNHLLPTALGVALAAATAVAPAGHAAFTSIDDFEALTPGTLNGQGDWLATTADPGDGLAVVATDPADGTNQVLRTDGGAVAISNNSASLLLADGTTGTLFMRIRFGNTDPQLRTGVGMTELTDTWEGVGNAFDDFRARIQMHEDDGNGRLQTTFGAAGTDQTLTTAVDQNTWYNLWFVIDNNADTTTLYLQSDDDADFASQTLLNGGDSPYAFDNGPVADALRSLIIVAGGGNDSETFYDDIFFDASGENLVNPIPEPGSLVLMGLGAALMIRRR